MGILFSFSFSDFIFFFLMLIVLYILSRFDLPQFGNLILFVKASSVISSRTTTLLITNLISVCLEIRFSFFLVHLFMFNVHISVNV